MKAIAIIERGGEGGVLELVERRTPEPGSRQVLVRVEATAVNRADLLQRRGQYPAPPGAPADIPGLEYAGVVARIASDVTEWAVGDRVMGLVGGGSYAEYVVVHEGEAIPVPAHFTAAEAAAIPEAFITAHDALITQCHLREGETVVVHAAASGVGTAAVQLAKAAGARVIGTVRSESKLERVRSLGADVVLQPGEEWAGDVLRATDGRGVDVVLDLVGGGYLPGNVRVLAPRGRLIVVGLTAGRESLLDLGAVLRKRLHIIGTVLRARTLDEKILTATAFTRDVFPLLATDRVRPVIDRVLPLSRAGEAHELLERNATVGKVVLEVISAGA
jgi:putative PIG3 family NAD(P)H quinone oxidoreductase